ncbi:hypothetical protein [Streptomyces sp. STR69]|uniref:hypothetical protein n=1 Tax=Streptomyces sp. STR69 TaxID=1796942 RepID=UPI0021C666E5|nr:hypothetical protein [Streptomyces sp. STR69]
MDESLANTVKANLDEEVEVALESFVLRSAAGRRSQRRYRLIEVAGQQPSPTREFRAMPTSDVKIEDWTSQQVSAE